MLLHSLVYLQKQGFICPNADIMCRANLSYWIESKHNFSSAHSKITPVSLTVETVSHNMDVTCECLKTEEVSPTPSSCCSLNSCIWLFMQELFCSRVLIIFTTQESYHLCDSSEMTPLFSSQRFLAQFILIVHAVFILFCTPDGVFPWSKMKGGRVSRALINHFL